MLGYDFDSLPFNDRKPHIPEQIRVSDKPVKQMQATAANLGRPSMYDEAFCDSVVQCFKEGMTFAEIARERSIPAHSVASIVNRYQL